MTQSPVARAANFKSKVTKPWKSHSQDGVELKAYIELGFCDRFKVAQI